MKKHKKHTEGNAVEISVRMMGYDNRATLKANDRVLLGSSTQSPEIAAQRAASKLFGCAEDKVELRQMAAGDQIRGEPRIFKANPPAP